MEQKIKPLWCVTAKSKLTGRRERVSIISSDKDIIDGLCAQYAKCKYRRKPYSDPKTEVYHPDMYND